MACLKPLKPEPKETEIYYLIQVHQNQTRQDKASTVKTEEKYLIALNTFMSATLLNLLFYSSSSKQLKSEDKWLTEQIQERFPGDLESKTKKVRIKF